jgi:transcriptional regulator with XRE-family HTH domain
MNLTELGQRIRSQRERSGLKQNDLAHALQVTPQAVSKWERGENAPDIGTLVPLAKILGVSVEWILGVYATDRDVFEATVLATGTRSTRERSESTRPREFAAWASAVCFQVTEAVLRNDGVPVKNIGPGVVAFFSGPEHQSRAVRAAVAAARGSSEKLKIGLCSGEIYFGAVGHPDYARPDVIGEAFVIAFLSRDFAAGNTGSGIVASTTVTEGLADRSMVGDVKLTRFEGIKHEVGLAEIRV